MALSKYVSAEWVNDVEFGTYTIRAIGDDGTVWFVPSLDSDVSPWPEFIEENGAAAITGVPPPLVKETPA